MATFTDVWFRHSRRREWFSVVVWQDRGRMEIGDGLLTFRGRKYSLEIRDILHVSAPARLDWVNTWVRVDYSDNGVARHAYFSDGSSLGWGGLLGGTSRLYEAIAQAARPQAAAAWYADPTGVHELRYWDGHCWTPHVSDQGVVTTDSLPVMSGA